MATRVPDAVRNTGLNTLTALLDAGAAAGKVEIRTGAQPADADDAATGTLLATITLPDPAFPVNGAAAGVATANNPVPAAAAATGTAGWFRALDSNNVKVVDGNCSASGGGGDMQLNTTSLVSGVDVDVTAWTITWPASQ